MKTLTLCLILCASALSASVEMKGKGTYTVDSYGSCKKHKPNKEKAPHDIQRPRVN